jgi:hypothetical protein
MQGGKMWGLPPFALMPISLLDQLAMIVCMKTKYDVAGKLARLPDGQLVRIEVEHSDGQTTVRRVRGKRRGQIAVCWSARLLPANRPAR